MGIRVVTHAIVKFGTDEQKCYFLPRILTGEVFFCQGYSDHVGPDRGVPPGIEIRPLVMTSGEKSRTRCSSTTCGSPRPTSSGISTTAGPWPRLPTHATCPGGPIAGWQPDIWRAFADELGILGATLPVEWGGIGGGPVEMIVSGNRRCSCTAPWA